MTDSRVSAEERAALREWASMPGKYPIVLRVLDALEAAEARVDESWKQEGEQNRRVAFLEIQRDGLRENLTVAENERIVLMNDVARVEAERDALRDEAVRFRDALEEIVRTGTLGPFELPRKNETPADSTKRLLYNKINQLAAIAENALSSTPTTTTAQETKK